LIRRRSSFFRCTEIFGGACFASVAFCAGKFVCLAISIPPAGSGDFSRLTTAKAAEVFTPPRDRAAAIHQLQDLVQRAAVEHRKISIAGARHSMGGHTLINGGLTVDMRNEAFAQIERVKIADGLATVCVGAGATWHELIAALDRQGWSIAVMQSNDDFTIGGSVSVNCHGWQPDAPPIVDTVQAFTLLRADGSVIECRRDRESDRELFSAVCGGYGLFGIILQLELRIVPNQLYRAQELSATAANYAERYDSLVVRSDMPVGLAYGRVSIAPGSWFLHDARIIRFVRVRTTTGHATNTIRDNGGDFSLRPSEIALARAAFRASVGNRLGKVTRWTIERLHGQTHRTLSRNGILQTPSDWFANRDPKYVEILHEYFVPPERLTDFLTEARSALKQENGAELLNVTVRKVKRDDVTMLAYAHEDVFGLVMLFRYSASRSADQQMADTTRKLIAAALDCRGSYYLPYRPHATLEQFREAYPQYAAFYELKRKYDPQEVFENSFYVDYVKPSATVTSAPKSLPIF
jgi:FAD/FMN-containing dehydrogenase